MIFADVRVARPQDRVAYALFAVCALACLIPEGAVPAWHAVPPWVGLLLGIGLALSLGNPFPARTRAVTPRLLQACVVGLGAVMDLKVVARVGLHGFVTTLFGIAAALFVGTVLGRALRVPRATSTLLSVGTAICGGSAIAAAAPVIDAGEDETSVALATVFLLNAVGLFLFPLLGHLMQMGSVPSVSGRRSPSTTPRVWWERPRATAGKRSCSRPRRS